MKAIKLITLYLFIAGALSACDQSGQKTVTSASSMLRSDTLTDHFRQQGRIVSKAAFQALSSALVASIEKGGVSHALHFCNEHALPVTDSVSTLYNVKIRRVSARNRNPENAADSSQLALMEYMQHQMVVKGSAKDTLIITGNGEAAYYAPITIAAPCLQCHGMLQSDVKAENLELLQKLYPQDKATGYAVGDLRGMWYLRFKI